MSADITFTCADGFSLEATRFDPSGPTRAHLIIAGATAVPQRFYRRFALHANTLGYCVTTFDYRGIGRSAPKIMRGFNANYTDWARQDLATVIDQVRQQAGAKPIDYVAHSFGGHALGMVSNHDAISNAYFFAVGAGWAGHMPPVERIKVTLMWHLLGPIVVPLLGYMPGSFIGGENLPIGVYRNWKHWCSFKRYFFDDPNAANLTAQFGEVRCNITAANALDDLWALPVSRDHFVDAYRAARVTRVDLDPKTLGMPIGHMGYFRQGREALWESCFNAMSLGNSTNAR
jgi:predicted alpha/beta hydrolase